jgi:acyl carrier protein
MENHFSISFSDSELNLASFSNLQVLAEFIAKKMES